MAWIMQFIYMSEENNTIRPLVVFFYVMGVVVLAVSGYVAGETNIVMFNMVSAAAALAVLLKLQATTKKA